MLPPCLISLLYFFASSFVYSSEGLSHDELVLKLPSSAIKKGPFQGRGDILEIVYRDKVNNQKLAYEQTYSNGKPKLWQQYDNGAINGEVVSWFENGRIEHVIPYRLGKMDGVCIHWNANGTEIGRYSMANGTGTQVIHHDNGKLKELQDYEDGAKSGRCITGLTNGRVSAICWVTKGRYFGPSLKYDANGLLELFAVINGSGQLEGPVLNFKGGELTRVDYWLDGQQLTKEQYKEALTRRPELPPVEENQDELLNQIRFP